MARKSWDQLSEGYRRRLERAGITPQSHAQGSTLARARGHISDIFEASQSRFYRDRASFVDKLATHYGRDPDDVREILDSLTRTEVENVIQTQRNAERLYDLGNKDAAGQAWAARDRNLPDWMFYYHGVFS